MLRQFFLLSILVGSAAAGMHRDVSSDDEVVLTRVLPAALPAAALCRQPPAPPPPPPIDDDLAVADAEGPEAEQAEIAALKRAPANRGVVRAGHPDYMRRRARAN